LSSTRFQYASSPAPIYHFSPFGNHPPATSLPLPSVLAASQGVSSSKTRCPVIAYSALLTRSCNHPLSLRTIHNQGSARDPVAAQTPEDQLAGGHRQKLSAPVIKRPARSWPAAAVQYPRRILSCGRIERNAADRRLCARFQPRMWPPGPIQASDVPGPAHAGLSRVKPVRSKPDRQTQRCEKKRVETRA